MSITKKKRTMIFISVSALLVLAAVAGFLTWWIKVGSRTVTETAELPPAVPDSVQYWKGKEKHSLSEQDEQTVYNTVVEALAKCEKTDTYLMPYTDEHTKDFREEYGLFVLQYSEIYKFTGTFPDELLYLQTFEQKEFDSIVFWPSGYCFDILLFCEGVCTNRFYCTLILSSREDTKTLIKTLQEVLSHYDFEKPAWANWEIPPTEEPPEEDLPEGELQTEYHPAAGETVQSSSLFPVPDAVIYQRTSAHMLHAEDEAKLIAAFEKLMASYTEILPAKQEYTADVTLAEAYLCGLLEFRYNVRVKYIGEPPEGWGNGTETDALWLFLREDGSVFLLRVLEGRQCGGLLCFSGIPEEVTNEYLYTVREVFANYDFEKPDWLTE